MESVEAELCFPHLLNRSCTKAPMNSRHKLFFYVQMCFIAFPTILLNLLAIISIAHFRQLHTSTNLILLSLAVSDLLVGLFFIPNEALKVNCWVFGDLLCIFYIFVLGMVFTASTGNIVLISVDRYIAICNPMHYATKMTKNVSIISICVCWLYALIITLFIVMDNIIHWEKYKACEGACVVYYSKDADLVFALVIPVSIILILYSRIFIVVMSQARSKHSHVTAAPNKNAVKSVTKSARNLGIVVLVYLICYIPHYAIFYSGMLFFGLAPPIQTFVMLLLFINSGLNPLIYSMIYPWFRKTIKLIVTLQILRSGSRELRLS